MGVLVELYSVSSEVHHVIQNSVDIACTTSQVVCVHSLSLYGKTAFQKRLQLGTPTSMIVSVVESRENLAAMSFFAAS